MQQTITGVTATTRRPTLTVTDTPTVGQLHVWWEAMQSDDLSVAYADSFPPTLTDFCLGVAQGERLFLLCLVDGQVAGGLWLHDLLHRRDGTVSAGWIGCYFLSAYRGRLALDLWQMARQHWEATGLAVPRRYATRRLFNALVAPGARQSPWQSWLEVSVDTVLAIVMAIMLQRLCYGSAATWVKAGGLTVAIYALTMGRRYTLRRVFEAWNTRQAGLPLYDRPATRGVAP